MGGFDAAAKEVGMKVVMASEICPKARATYVMNFGHEHLHGDVTKIPSTKIPNHDILVGGFPCQPFSSAGLRQGINDKKGRGLLFRQILRFLKAKKPSSFILENVVGLLSNDKGRTFKTILKALDGLGYSVQWKILNSKDFGVPHYRRRIFIIGFKKNLKTEIVWPLPHGTKQHYSSIIDREYKTANMPLATEHKKKLFKAININPSNNGIVAYSTYSKTKTFPIVPCLTTKMGHMLVNGTRYLSPRELLRAQGFSESYKIDGISYMNVQRQVGNAVTVPLVAELFEAVKNALKNKI
jgi:DNA (cytosine-5)-methyltransferase 1